MNSTSIRYTLRAVVADLNDSQSSASPFWFVFLLPRRPHPSNLIDLDVAKFYDLLLTLDLEVRLESSQ